MRPDPKAKGDHSVIKNGQDGKTQSYQTFQTNPKSPSGFQPGKRYDGIGRAHGDIKAPHVHPNGKGAARKPTRDEYPRHHLPSDPWL